MTSGHPAFEDLRQAVEALTTGTGTIQERLLAAEPHFGQAFDQKPTMQRPAEQHLGLRIGAAFVEAGPEDCTVAESITALSDARAAETAGDILRLYELVADLRNDDGYGYGLTQ